MKIAVIGSGFVGQATAKGLIKHANNITFVDTDRQIVSRLREHGYDAHLSGQYSTINTAVTIFCVPTTTADGRLHMGALKEAVEAFAERLKNHKGYHVVIIRSTIPPTTARSVVLPTIERISGKKAGKDFGLCVQPEYLRKATAAQDSARPWFVLIGQSDAKAGDVVEKLYRKFDAPIQRVSLEEAEFQKYVHNAFNALKVSFFEEMRRIAETEKMDADTVMLATAESSEAIWNPLYGLRAKSEKDSKSSNLPYDSYNLLQWATNKGYKVDTVKGLIAANQSAYKAEAPTPDKVTKAPKPTKQPVQAKQKAVKATATVTASSASKTVSKPATSAATKAKGSKPTSKAKEGTR